MEYIIAIIVGSLVLVGMILAIPWLAISTYHKRKLEEIRSKQKIEINEETRAAIEALRKEMAALRDTTTQYDVSFDSALNRLDSRMEHMEQRIGRIERQDREAESVHVRPHS